MFAKNLETLLSELSQKSDVSRIGRQDFVERFDCLRRNGQLPRGRENRAKLLTTGQIAAAIFGLASTRPGWAGHAAIILSKLVPVGGSAASFYGSNSLLKAVECLLDDAKAREGFIDLYVSLSESAINSHGFATLSYEKDGIRHQSFYVPQEAVSLLQPGAERDFDAEPRYSMVSRDTRYSRELFDRIAIEIERAKAFPTEPDGDGSEYDAEEAEQERYRKLGVQAGSRFLNVGVDNQVTWPRHETLVKFDKFHFVLMPKTSDHVQSAHIDLTANRLSDLEAMTVINRFLSIMTWCDDQYAIMQGGWSGNPIPAPVPKRDLAFTTAYDWVFDRKIPEIEDARRAIAIYREARNAEQNYLISYAVLGYYKLIELKHKGRSDTKKWIREKLEELKDLGSFADSLKQLEDARGSEAPHDYLYRACRSAVAHANKPYSSDPDDLHEIRRFHVAADVLRQLARHFIERELQVSDCMFDGS